MNSCLLVIDFINEIVNEKGKAPSCANYVKEHNIIQKANSAIQLARDFSSLILFVKVAFSPEYYELPSNSPVFSGAKAKDAFKIGEWGTEFHELLDYQQSDAMLVKTRVSSFYATPLEAFLRAKRIDTLFLAGVSTNNAIQATARDAHDRDYRVIILEDACGAKDKQHHENTLTLLKDVSIITSVDQMTSYFSKNE